MQTRRPPRYGYDLSAAEAGYILGVHPSTVNRAADAGELPCRRTPGGHRRFRRTDVETYAKTLLTGDATT